VAENSGDHPIVIVGGGQAAVQFCFALRKEKVETPVVLLSEEAEYPYHKPPLSKSFLTGESDRDKLDMRPVSFYESKNIDVHLNARVVEITPESNTIRTESQSYSYSSLILATGARPRPLPLVSDITANRCLGGVHYLRDLADAVQIKKELETASNIVVVGAGFIGLEFAIAAKSDQCEVTVFDMADRVMGRAVSPLVSQWYEAMHKQAAINIRLEDSIKELRGEGEIKYVVSQSGDVVDCDMLVVGIGVIPNDDLAQSAGLTCNNGIVVNEYCETSVERIYAIGDCASHPNRYADGAMVRLESIQNATDQARVIASALAGDKKPYEAVPWFWSDQGPHSLQMVGLGGAEDAEYVTRGDPASGSFSVFQYVDKQLVCIDSVNAPRDHMLGRKFLSAGVSPTIEQAADAQFDLKSLL